MAGNGGKILGSAGMEGLENLPDCGKNELVLMVGNATKPGLAKLSSSGLLVLAPGAGIEVKPQAHRGIYPSKDKVLP